MIISIFRANADVPRRLSAWSRWSGRRTSPRQFEHAARLQHRRSAEDLGGVKVPVLVGRHSAVEVGEE